MYFVDVETKSRSLIAPASADRMALLKAGDIRRWECVEQIFQGDQAAAASANNGNFHTLEIFIQQGGLSFPFRTRIRRRSFPLLSKCGEDVASQKRGIQGW